MPPLAKRSRGRGGRASCSPRTSSSPLRCLFRFSILGNLGKTVKVLIVNTSLLFLNKFIIILEREYETHGILVILCLQAENSPIEINQYNQISYGKLQRTSQNSSHGNILLECQFESSISLFLPSIQQKVISHLQLNFRDPEGVGETHSLAQRCSPAPTAGSTSASSQPLNGHLGAAAAHLQLQRPNPGCGVPVGQRGRAGAAGGARCPEECGWRGQSAREGPLFPPGMALPTCSRERWAPAITR